jgi:alpha-glucosidase
MPRKNDPLRRYMETSGKRLIETIKQVEKINAAYTKRYTVKPRAHAAWYSPGAVLDTKPYERGIRIACERGWIELHWLTPDCLRVRLRTVDPYFVPPFSYAVHKVDWIPVPFELDGDRQAIVMRSSALVCHVSKNSFRLQIELTDGRTVCSDKAGMQWCENGTVRLTLTLRPNESCYGFGMRAAGLNLRSKRLKLWNMNPGVVERGSDPLGLSAPFYLGVDDSFAYGVFWDNASRGTADLGATVPDELTFEAERGELRYYVFGGANADAVISRYTELTGRTHLPALWQLGYQQATAAAIAEELPRRNIPCDMVNLNPPPSPSLQLSVFDETQLTALKHRVQALHDQGFKAVATLTPGIPADVAAQLDSDLFLKYPDGKPAQGVQWGGGCCYLDFSNPMARVWWREIIQRLLHIGVDGFVYDLAEPSALTTSGRFSALPDAVIHTNDGLMGNHQESRNTYALLMARATHDAVVKYAPYQRISGAGQVGFSGLSPYAGVWISGLIANWDSLRLCISIALNLTLSGVALVGADVGGQYEQLDGELYTRWMQAVCLMPLLRTRRFDDDISPISFGQPYEVINRLILELRYRFLPHLYSLVALNREYGTPVLRPTFMLEPGNLVLRSEDDTYLVGDTLLVAPVLEKGRITRLVYLLSGSWYDYWSNELYDGGKAVPVPAPLERLPLFVRAGAVLALWQELEAVSDKPTHTPVLRIYSGEGETILYEDAGEGTEYLHGDYRWVYLSCRWEDNARLVITRRVAGRYRAPYRTIKIEIVGFVQEPLEIQLDRQRAPIWFYDEGVLEINADDGFSRLEITRQPNPEDDTRTHRKKT